MYALIKYRTLQIGGTLWSLVEMLQASCLPVLTALHLIDIVVPYLRMRDIINRVHHFPTVDGYLITNLYTSGGTESCSTL